MDIVNVKINSETASVSVNCPHCDAKEEIQCAGYSKNLGDFFKHGLHYGHDCSQCLEEFIFITLDKDKNPDNTLVTGKRASFGISGIKCDREGCGYADMTVEFADYPKWFDKPCPSCGDPLLTKEHLQEVEAMIMTTELLNNIDDEALKEIAELARNLKPEETQALIASLPQGIQDAFSRNGMIDRALSNNEKTDTTSNGNDSNTDTGSDSVVTDTSSSDVVSFDGGASCG